ncbi:MAG: energy transducer TonB [Gammaproteobacteria bacterium]|nr:energy transducer TonB [Gammaproteobacteria bacterium]
MYAGEQDAEEAQDARRSLVIGIVVAIVLLTAVAYGVVRMMKHSAMAPPPREQKITVIPHEEPPPPPPPPKQEPPPEQQKVEQPVPEEKPVEDAPKEANDEPPPGDQLGLDATGTGDGDGFGLAAKKGGRGLIGGAGDRNRWYAGQISQQLLNALNNLGEDDAARRGRRPVVVKIWVAADGRVERFDLGEGSGDAKADEAMRRTLSGLRLSEAPPEDMPQPVRLRIGLR